MSDLKNLTRLEIKLRLKLVLPNSSFVYKINDFVVIFVLIEE